MIKLLFHYYLNDNWKVFSCISGFFYNGNFNLSDTPYNNNYYNNFWTMNYHNLAATCKSFLNVTSLSLNFIIV